MYNGTRLVVGKPGFRCRRPGADHVRRADTLVASCDARTSRDVVHNVLAADLCHTAAGDCGVARRPHLDHLQDTAWWPGKYDPGFSPDDGPRRRLFTFVRGHIRVNAVLFGSKSGASHCDSSESRLKCHQSTSSHRRNHVRWCCGSGPGSRSRACGRSDRLSNPKVSKTIFATLQSSQRLAGTQL